MAAAKAKVVEEPVVEKVEEPVVETAEEPVVEAAVEEAPKKRGRKPGSSVKTAKAEVKASLILQYGDNETDISLVEDRVKAQFVAEGHRASTIKTMNIYVKPEDYAAYYVINDKFSGRVDLF